MSGYPITRYPLEFVSVGGMPIAPTTLVSVGGTPVAVLGGVFSGGFPLGGPVTQTFRGGGGPQPPTLFAATLTPAGPIGEFFIGGGGVPLVVPVGGPFIGPIGAVPPPISTIGGFGPAMGIGGAPPASGLGAGGGPIGGR